MLWGGLGPMNLLFFVGLTLLIYLSLLSWLFIPFVAVVIVAVFEFAPVRVRDALIEIVLFLTAVGCLYDMGVLFDARSWAIMSAILLLDSNLARGKR